MAERSEAKNEKRSFASKTKFIYFNAKLRFSFLLRFAQPFSTNFCGSVIYQKMVFSVLRVFSPQLLMLISCPIYQLSARQNKESCYETRFLV